MGDIPDTKRVHDRANALLPEEREVGSDDPEAQAEQILAESDARCRRSLAAPEKAVERRQSEDTVEPPGMYRYSVGGPRLTTCPLPSGRSDPMKSIRSIPTSGIGTRAARARA